MKYYFFKLSFLLILFFFNNLTCFSQGKPGHIKLGAYYFDGWTGKSDFHLNQTIKDSFPERRPIWGWITSTPEIMAKQIDVASAAGVDFFNFCWYYNPDKNGNMGNDPKNNALNLFVKSANKNKMEFSIMIANHKGYVIKENDWDALIKQWCILFKDPTYLKVDNKPLITFFSIETLVQTFGTYQKVNQAFQRFRKYAEQQGLDGVTIGAILSPSKDRAILAEKCGYDLLTGYNMHKLGLSWSEKKNSIEKMRLAEQKAWRQLSIDSKLPQIPVVTLNWDTRPIDIRASLQSSRKISNPRFDGFSGNSVKESIRSAKVWIQQNEQHITKEKIVMVYAWNEYGEGAWLTPSETLKDSLLQGLKEGLRE